MDTVTLLHDAADLLKSGWCQGNGSLDAAGRAVVPRSPRAVKWCLAGALDRAAADSWRDACVAARELARTLREQTGRVSLVGFNDHHAESVDVVLALIADTCERLMQEE